MAAASTTNATPEECLRVALEPHPKIAEARAKAEKSGAAISVAKRRPIPDVESFARYSYRTPGLTV